MRRLPALNGLLVLFLIASRMPGKLSPSPGWFPSETALGSQRPTSSQEPWSDGSWWSELTWLHRRWVKVKRRRLFRFHGRRYPLRRRRPPLTVWGRAELRRLWGWGRLLLAYLVLAWVVVCSSPSPELAAEPSEDPPSQPESVSEPPFPLIRPPDDWRFLLVHPKALERYQMLSAHYLEDRPLVDIYRDFHTTAPTFGKWRTRYAAEGVYGLVNRKPGPKAPWVVTPVRLAQLEALAQQPALKAKGSVVLSRRLARLPAEDGSRPPSPRTVNRMLQQLGLNRPPKRQARGNVREPQSNDEPPLPAPTPVTVTIDHQNQVVTRHGGGFILPGYLDRLLRDARQALAQVCASPRYRERLATLDLLYGLAKLVCQGTSIHQRHTEHDPAVPFLVDLNAWPSQASQHGALHNTASRQQVQELGITLARQVYRDHQLFTGRRIAVDPHHTPRDSALVGKGFNSLRRTVLPGFRPVFVHDLDDDSPIYLVLGQTNAKRADRIFDILAQVERIVGKGGIEELYTDKEFYAGLVLATLTVKWELKVCQAIPKTPTVKLLLSLLSEADFTETITDEQGRVVRRLAAVPLKLGDLLTSTELAWRGAHCPHCATVCQRDLLLVVMCDPRRPNWSYTFISNEPGLSALEIVTKYQLHWRIENYLKEEKYGQHLDNLPGYLPQEVLLHYLLIMVVHWAVLLFKQDLAALELPTALCRAEIKTLKVCLFERLAHVARHPDRIVVTFLERFAHQAALQSLAQQWADTPVSLLGNRQVEMVFL